MLETLTTFFGQDEARWVLFISAFVSATLFPGGSEAVLIGMLKVTPESVISLVLIATVGNTLGALTSVLIGRIVPEKEKSPKAICWMKRFGAPFLLLTWLPIVGDGLALVAGWLRLPWLSSVFFIALGKLIRYAALAMLVQSI